MTEKEKMIQGKPYYSSDSQLVFERKNAREMTYKFNNLPPGEQEEKNNIIKRLFGKTGKNFFVEQPFRCDYGYNIYVGENFYVNFNCVILDCARVTIGNNVFFGPDVSLYTAGHPIFGQLRSTGIEYAFPITIGNDVWIGGNTVINPGVTIGDNSVIGSGSVVTKDIPSNVVAAGNPCRVIREITDDDRKYYYKNLRI